MPDDNNIAAQLEQTLAALREREQDFISLLENAQDFVVYRVAVDPTAPYGGYVVLVSPSIRELLGISDPYRFETWFENLHPEDAPHVLAANRRAWQEGVPYNQAARVYHPLRQEWIWVHTMSRPVFDEKGTLTHFNGLILDITEQKRAEAALQEQVAFNTLITTISTRFINLPLEKIDSGIDDALALVGTRTGVDRSYVFLYANDGRTMDCRYEWCAEGIMPQISRLHGIPTQTLAWSSAILQRGDVLHIPRVSELPPEARAEQEEFQAQDIQSLVAVPISYRGNVLGLLGFDAVRHEKTWTEDTLNLLQILGAIFANALEHKRSQQALQEAQHTLERRVEERTREIERRRQAAESLGGILKLLNSDSPTATVLRYIVAEASRLLGAEASAIHQVDYERAFVVIGAAQGFPAELADIDGFPLLTSQADRIILERQPYWETLSAETVARYLERTKQDTTLDPRVRRWRMVTMQHYRTFLAVPLVIRDQVYGSLTFYYTEPLNVDEEKINLAQTFADQVSLAIENARLREQVEVAAVAAERNRIARELHDSVSQALYGIALGTRTARTLVDRQPVEDQVKTTLANPLEYVLSLAEAGLAEMRALIFELRPDALEKEGLIAALTKQAEAIRVRHKLDIHTDFCSELPDLPLATKEALYRVAQEALNNLIKHADARRVVLRLQCVPGTLTLEVQDDGVGFDLQADYPGHLGLHTMRERVERLGGELAIESAPGAGTTVQATFPLH